MARKRIIYGNANYADLVQKQGYFVDKTPYIAQLELVENPIYLRPRRFGKSMFCSLLHYYYDRNAAPQFDELFGQTWIGQQPTGLQNQYMVLHFNFSTVEVGVTLAAIEREFKIKCNALLQTLRQSHADLLADLPEFLLEDSVSSNLNRLISYISGRKLPPLYVIIDEYDNFANHLITTNRDRLYHALTADDSFLKTFFKTLKEGRERRAIANVFITGILPMTMDDLASAFNVGTYLTLDRMFEAMIGFTQAEVAGLLDQIYMDYSLDPTTRSDMNALLKNQYDGYHFASHEGEPLYNTTSLLYFLRELTLYKEPPLLLTDLNLRTDLHWVQRLTGSNPANTENFVETLTTENRISFSPQLLVSKFNLSQFFEPPFYPISFFYLGMLTRLDDFSLTLPNVNMRQIFAQYFNELNHIDVETRYAEIMSAFINRPNLEQLFAGYWQEYVSQLPEAIFQKMNENFYRTTFYELCSRHLSRWFTWHLERSYPQGKSDLEFVGKYNEKYANLRWVIEFKYYSNAAFKKKFKTTLANFQLQAEDTEQIDGYAVGLRQEFPHAHIERYVIYCIGNQGFRVFTVTTDLPA
ncbi:MAG: AAA family ATPase [Caldilinea sp. CFX5]|nr:AAA family ATPase [Caldilinea sp. CFX5]